MTIDDPSARDEAFWDGVVAELTARTRDGRLTWTTDARVQRSPSEAPTTPAYVTVFDRWRVAVYGHRWVYWYEEDQYELIDATAIELIDEDGRPEWRLPETRSSSALLDAVGRQHSGADRFAELLLSSSDTAEP
ncbi:MAG: hypothetical protein KF729_09410 [Sandaracinaceae bacterium]|nr:hypothetical protein [Sandaracinaceae bacterium]